MSKRRWGVEAASLSRSQRSAAWVAASLAVAVLFVASAALANASPPPSPDAPEVELSLPPIEEPKPEPPPPPDPPPPPVKAPTPPPVQKQTQLLPESPSAPSGNGIETGGGRDPGLGTGGGTAPPAPPAPAAAPPPPPPKPQTVGPIQLPENATAPVAISKTLPSYPEAARSEGIEMTVIVKYVVTEHGDVTNVRILKGHPLLDPDVMRVVKSWRFSPAMHEGHPIAVFHVSRIPFALKK